MDSHGSSITLAHGSVIDNWGWTALGGWNDLDFLNFRDGVINNYASMYTNLRTQGAAENFNNQGDLLIEESASSLRVSGNEPRRS